MAEVTEYAPFAPDFKANPFPIYARLRAEQPIHRAVMPHGRGIWLVTRFGDAVAVLRDPWLVKDPTHAVTPERRRR